MKRLKLYSTQGCHLCEQAEALLLDLQPDWPFEIDHVEIGDDDRLVARYGTRIPVVATEDGIEIDAPLSRALLEAFCQQYL